MSNIKRIVNTKFWKDEKIIDDYSVEDKYFLLYLMTNPHTKQVGIYKLPKRIISFETGYAREVVEVLLQRFQDSYKNIVYSKDTQEITVLNSLKYSIVKGGKPVEDCLKKELKIIEDSSLILETYKHLLSFWELSDRPFDKTVKSLFISELEKRKVAKEKMINDNDNDNDNERIVDESHNESSREPPVPYEKIKNLYNETCKSLSSIRSVSATRKKHIKARWTQFNKDINTFKEAFKLVESSKFLTGTNDRSWKADFDWLIKNDSNMLKVLEGKYKNNDRPKPKGGPPKNKSKLDLDHDYDMDILEKKLLNRSKPT